MRVVGSAIVAVVVITIPWTIRVAAGIVGKDRTLTGRTEIWDFVLDMSKDRWFAGYGFRSFWDTEAHRIALGQRREFTTVPDAAHSTFFEVLLYLGVVGLVLLLALVALSLGRTWWRAFGAPGWKTAWLAAVVTFALLENVTESMIAYHSIFWVLLIAPAFALSGGRDERFGSAGYSTLTSRATVPSARPALVTSNDVMPSRQSTTAPVERSVSLSVTGNSPSRSHVRSSVIVTERGSSIFGSGEPRLSVSTLNTTLPR